MDNPILHDQLAAFNVKKIMEKASIIFMAA